MTGNEYAGLVLLDYVPPPELATADRLIGAHYFPGWRPGAVMTYLICPTEAETIS